MKCQSIKKIENWKSMKIANIDGESLRIFEDQFVQK